MYSKVVQLNIYTYLFFFQVIFPFRLLHNTEAFLVAGKCFLGCPDNSEKGIKAKNHRWLTVNAQGRGG